MKESPIFNPVFTNLTLQEHKIIYLPRVQSPPMHRGTFFPISHCKFPPCYSESCHVTEWSPSNNKEEEEEEKEEEKKKKKCKPTWLKEGSMYSGRKPPRRKDRADHASRRYCNRAWLQMYARRWFRVTSFRESTTLEDNRICLFFPTQHHCH